MIVWGKFYQEDHPSYMIYDKKFINKPLAPTHMGSNLSPILTAIAKGYLLDRILPTLPFRFCFFKKYVVDNLIIALPKCELNSILNPIVLILIYNSHLSVKTAIKEYPF